jgi:hypothetical protein
MPFHLPKALQTQDDAEALRLVRKYYERRPGTPMGTALSGARFDEWDSLGRRHADANRFTADDVVAVSFLGIAVPAKASWVLLCGRPDDFNNALADFPDQDLAEVDPGTITCTWTPWMLWDLLREIPGIDWVTAGKLLARKRPQLIPVYDRIVKSVTGRDPNFWRPLCEALRLDDNALHHRLIRLRTEAGVSSSVPAIRIFDVIAWLEGKEQGW